MAKPYPDDLYSLLCCACSARGALTRSGDELTCTACGLKHPIVDGVPVILDPQRSVFDAQQVIQQYRRPPKQPGKRAKSLERFVPRAGSNLVASRIVEQLNKMLKAIDKPRILVVGGGEPGAGLQALLSDPRYVFVESDIYFGSRCCLIADGHHLPFKAECFDAVICQAVLEHVLRPQVCIDEMHRVLKPEGVLFVDVPFLYPVHMGAHDFTRFTLGGLRVACRWFKECEAGVSGGPGQAVAHAILYYSRSLSRAKLWRAFCRLVLPWFVFWLHHLDKRLVNKPEGSDTASGVYFLGTKATQPRSDREILQIYWGNQEQRKVTR
jgi:SAM-dependent methyltransferase